MRPHPMYDPADEVLDETRLCPFREQGCLARADSYGALLGHLKMRHPGRWPAPGREGLSEETPWPDAEESYDLDSLSAAQLDTILHALLSTDVHPCD